MHNSLNEKYRRSKGRQSLICCFEICPREHQYTRPSPSFENNVLRVLYWWIKDQNKAGSAFCVKLIFSRSSYFWLKIFCNISYRFDLLLQKLEKRKEGDCFEFLKEQNKWVFHYRVSALRFADFFFLLLLFIFFFFLFHQKLISWFCHLSPWHCLQQQSPCGMYFQKVMRSQISNWSLQWLIRCLNMDSDAIPVWKLDSCLAHLLAAVLVSPQVGFSWSVSYTCLPLMSNDPIFSKEH